MQVSLPNNVLDINSKKNLDFTIIVDGKEYKCSSFRLISVSQKAQVLYKTHSLRSPMEIVDPNTRRPIKDPHGYFKQVIDAIQGKNIEITDKNSTFLIKIGRILGIQCILDTIFDIKDKPLSKENIFAKLRYYFEENIENENYRIILNYIVKNWKELKNSEELRELPIPLLKVILKSENLASGLKRDVFNWIHDICEEKGGEYGELYSCVNINDFTCTMMNKCVDDISYDCISGDIWDQLKVRLREPIDKDGDAYEEEVSEHETSDRSQDDEQIVPNFEAKFYNASEKFEQIFQQEAQEREQEQHKQQAELIQRTHSTPAPMSYSFTPSPPQEEPEEDVDHHPPGTIDCEFCNDKLFGVIGNLQDMYPTRWRSFFNVTGGGSKQGKILHIFNYDDIFGKWWDNYNNGFSSSDAWIKVAFNDYKLIMTHYTLANGSERRNCHQPKRWRIDASNDDVNWTEIQMIKTQQMNVPTPLVNFKLNRPTEPFRIFRWTMLENNTTRTKLNQYEFSISALEMFGYLIPE